MGKTRTKMKTAKVAKIVMKKMKSPRKRKKVEKARVEVKVLQVVTPSRNANNSENWCVRIAHFLFINSLPFSQWNCQINLSLIDFKETDTFGHSTQIDYPSV